MSHKSKLNEYCQQNRLSAPIYTITHQEGPSHQPEFTAQCSVDETVAISCSVHSTRKAAEQDAACVCYNALVHNRLAVVSSSATNISNTRQISFMRTYYLVDMSISTNIDPSVFGISNHNYYQVVLFKTTSIHGNHSCYDVKICNVINIGLILYCSKLKTLLTDNDQINIIGDYSTYKDYLLEEEDNRIKVISYQTYINEHT